MPLPVNRLLSRSYRACPHLVNSTWRFDEVYDTDELVAALTEIFLCTTIPAIAIVGNEYGTERYPVVPSLRLALRPGLSMNGRIQQQLCVSSRWCFSHQLQGPDEVLVLDNFGTAAVSF